MTASMRQVLIDWIIEGSVACARLANTHVYVTLCRAVHFKFKLKSQTLYTTISLILRYLSKVSSPLASPYDHRRVVVQSGDM
jgi:hypothetical protein